MYLVLKSTLNIRVLGMCHPKGSNFTSFIKIKKLNKKETSIPVQQLMVQVLGFSLEEPTVEK